MKTNIRAFAVAALFAAVSLMSALHAQTGTVVKVNVPFAFNCGATQFAPGTYTLNMLRMDTMLVRSRRKAGLAMTEPDYSLTANKTGYALFRKYGGRYFLEQVWLPGSTTHIEVYESKWEKRAATELARQGSEPTRIELALLDVSQDTSH
jgi:hypothetical protein